MHLSNDLRSCDCVTNRLKRNKCAFIHHCVNGYFLWIKNFCQSHCGLNTKFMIVQHNFAELFYTLSRHSSISPSCCTMTMLKDYKNPEAHFWCLWTWGTFAKINIAQLFDNYLQDSFILSTKMYKRNFGSEQCHKSLNHFNLVITTDIKQINEHSTTTLLEFPNIYDAIFNSMYSR